MQTPKIGDTIYGCKCVSCGDRGRTPKVSRSVTGQDKVEAVYMDGTVRTKSGDIYKVELRHGNWCAVAC